MTAAHLSAPPPLRKDPLDDCVHCGFCLPHCPTYVSWGEEMDSPRGRIELMRGLRDGRLALTGEVASHFDRCLGCLGCVTACPSGVRYGELIERTRAQVEAARPRPLPDRLFRGLLFALFPYPARLRVLLPLLWAYQASGLQRLLRATGLVRLLPARLRALEGLLPRLRLRELRGRLPARTAARGERRLRVALVTGCVQQVFFPGVNGATARVLSAEGCDVLAPPQGCCGALSMHAGREAESLALARALVTRLEATRADVYAVNAAGCGSHLKDLGRLLAGDPAWAERARDFSARVRDVSEVLTALPARAVRHPVQARVAYQPSCHLFHAQGLRSEPQALLRAIPGVELVEVGDQCCGSAGVYNLLEPASAAEIGARKAEAILAVRPDVLASANPGCLLQLGGHLRGRGAALPALHPIELLDVSIRGARRTPPPAPAPGQTRSVNDR
ncbi:(Fe-S)-binding protein [Anaeromyxobacter paludicola]|uniref:Glycolate oxidase iron-sulfur subunit n=1 Tax=Anaeromyxobacter paludicola TaxID=2918171 RepID=A0ABM7XA58_9BACT|nr:heterodisulfide reductase-related iron-sulfur binding cluster [Anaeromyxobacter paludicola]BDG08730.1 glycolate oxidase iron-sulfur subunit [Anaeromyxobacter paludicola]